MVSFTFVLVASALAPHAAEARTGPKLALDGEAAAALQPDRMMTGGGGALRLGFELDATILSLTPEIGGSYHSFGGSTESITALRGFGGARLALGAAVRPGIYGHVGYAHVGEGSASRDAPTYDGGLFLDFTLLPIIDLGLHGGYAMIAASPEGAANHWLNGGAHIAFSF